MSKIEKINSLLLSELAAAVNREVDLSGALVTITYVNCDPDLKTAKVGFSVLPDKLAGTALRVLSAASGQLVPIISRRLRLRQIPHLIWEFDATEKEADRIERLLARLDD